MIPRSVPFVKRIPYKGVLSIRTVCPFGTYFLYEKSPRYEGCKCYSFSATLTTRLFECWVSNNRLTRPRRGTSSPKHRASAITRKSRLRIKVLPCVFIIFSILIFVEHFLFRDQNATCTVTFFRTFSSNTTYSAFSPCTVSAGYKPSRYSIT